MSVYEFFLKMNFKFEYTVLSQQILDEFVKLD